MVEANPSIKEIIETLTESGSGPGCHGHVIEKDGFKITAYVSIDEDFVGVNIGGTNDSWDSHDVKWDLKVYSGDLLIATDSRKLPVPTLRGLGSLGTFYSSNLKEKLEATHTAVLNVKVIPKILPIIKEVLTENGSGPGCHGHVIEKDGFKITAYLSMDENFAGVNIGGTEAKWDKFYVEWSLSVLYEGEVMVLDARKLSVPALRGCGSLGTSYPNEYNDKFIQGYQVNLKVSVVAADYNDNDDSDEEELNLF